MSMLAQVRGLIVAAVCLLTPGLAHAETTKPLQWTPANGDELVFDVYRNGKPFGHHVVKFQRDGEMLTVDTDIELEVKIGPIRAFHYVHQAKETWTGGELQKLTAKTKSDGKWKSVSAMRTTGGLEIKGPANTGIEPLGLIPSTHWNIAEMRQNEMLSSETGALLPIKVEDLGRETVRVGEAEVQATHYRVTSDLIASFWYDAEGRWVKCAFEARGSEVEYVLRALPG